MVLGVLQSYYFETKGKSFCVDCLVHQSNMAILPFYMENRNHVVHNQNKKTISSVALSKLHQKTSELYSRYSNDPHMIPEYLRYLFKHPIAIMHQLSEYALRCWVDTIEEASRLQESLRHEIKSSVHCPYWFLGKDPLTLLASSSPTSTKLTG